MFKSYIRLFFLAILTLWVPGVIAAETSSKKAYGSANPGRNFSVGKVKRILVSPFHGMNASCSKVCDSPKICDRTTGSPNYVKLQADAINAQEFCVRSCLEKKGTNQTSGWIETYNWGDIIAKHCGKSYMSGRAGELSNLVKVKALDCKNCSYNGCRLNKSLVPFCSKECGDTPGAEACREIRKLSGDAMAQFGEHNKTAEGAGMTVGVVKKSVVPFKNLLSATNTLLSRIKQPKTDSIQGSLDIIKETLAEMVDKGQIETAPATTPVEWDPPKFNTLVSALNANIIQICHLMPVKKGRLFSKKPATQTGDYCNNIKNQTVAELMKTVEELTARVPAHSSAKPSPFKRIRSPQKKGAA